MAKKYEPSAEELKKLMTAYNTCGTYSGAARTVGLSVAIATRLIKQNTTVNQAQPTKQYDNYEFTGPREPNVEEVISIWFRDEDWRKEYAE